ncbi:ATP-binding protein [Candidatus Nomurabacteria bacterium]|uniref:ATP-binding protein n=1 Tax=candidate division WWE3 bacterium TaxID=2053526 RepID=A0A955E157_UNCKA|nr:ATP-binding protein [candidate division WWE3 bacterium]MCB9823599.1 ATP-binding protein [Candidatus Nomurabacteria bacterium]MCB9827394.1 ATP-binding protein [Candidatus Nomurabacteria bacterium]HXK52941.1 ATP-binding protein [bacterium]
MPNKILSVVASGSELVRVEIEVVVKKRGFPSFELVGLVGKDAVECKKRILCAFESAGIRIRNMKVLVNLRPSNVVKSGAHFDLAISAGILLAIKKLTLNRSLLLVGEVSLSGHFIPSSYDVLVKMQHVLNEEHVLIVAGEIGLKRHDSVQNFYFVESIEDLGVFLESLSRYQDFASLPPAVEKKGMDIFGSLLCYDSEEDSLYRTAEKSFDSILGNEKIKRALEISAVGRHSLYVYGPPGSGKTTLLNSLVFLLPKMEPKEALRSSILYGLENLSSASSDRAGVTLMPPCRILSHTTSVSSLTGKSNSRSIGELSLAHNGVLIMNELNLFSSKVSDLIKEVLDDKAFYVIKDRRLVKVPSEFILLASSNLCPCGYYGSEIKKCTCLPFQVRQFNSKISGAFLDRFDMTVYAEQVTDTSENYSSEKVMAEDKKLVTNLPEKDSYKFEQLKNKIFSAVEYRKNRLLSFPDSAQINNKNIYTPEIFFQKSKITLEAKIFALSILKSNSLSMRGFSKFLALSRTLADIDSDEKIRVQHVAEAISFKEAVALQ